MTSPAQHEYELKTELIDKVQVSHTDEELDRLAKAMIQLARSMDTHASQLGSRIRMVEQRARDHGHEHQLTKNHAEWTLLLMVLTLLCTVFNVATFIAILFLGGYLGG